ncbi:MAG TPA: DUF4437 domain-containing protein [Kofleriaceae bacterium]|nr:DUF4437 domain-containing protein [Kofleriaceae bacterium]
MKKLLLLMLVACGSKPAPQAPPPPLGSDAAKPDPAPPADAADRKHASVTTPDQLHWSGGSAPVGPAMHFIKVQNGAAFDVTEGPAVVVSGTVENEKGQQVVYWNQHAHRLMCNKGTDCIVFAHGEVKADSKDLLASDLKWAQLDPARPDPVVVPLWGDGTAGPNGFLMKMKAGGGPFWHVHKNDYQGVVLVGNVVSYESGTQPRTMPPGSTWWQPGGNKHTTDCQGPTDCVIYLDFAGAFDVKPVL